MRLAEQWNAIEQRLDPRWSDARLELVIEDGAQRTRALALLAPAGPGGIGATIRFFATRGGVGVGPEHGNSSGGNRKSRDGKNRT